MADAEEVEGQAVERLVEMADYSPAAFAALKAARVEAVARQYESQRQEKDETFLGCWFSETGQRLLRQAARKF